MSRPPGLPKTGGRKKGVGNKRSTFRVARTTQVLEAKGLNPIEEILKLIPSLEAKEQVKAWEYIHQYADVKPKELPEPEEQEFDDALEGLTTDQLIELAKREQ